MARDKGLEELVQHELASVRGITEKAMFGGWAWLLRGHLLCGARTGSLLVRLGKGLDGWALEIDGVVPMQMRGRTMSGWVRCGPPVYAQDALRARLLARAVDFVRTLPAK